jgi:DNA-nicking Smr family endonuclease
MIGVRNPRRLRRLSADEHTLWRAVTREIKPLHGARASEGEPLLDDASASEPSVERAAAAERSAAHAPPPRPAASTPPPLAPLERRLRQRLAKGHAAIERRLDLHGLTQREAHDALVHFLSSAHAHGARVVLVVTGKGGRGERDPFVERGVLRRLVPQWLNTPELRRLVVGFEPAHVGHGGDGALYVRLRRSRG